MFNEKELQQFDKWGKGRPTHEPHGTDQEIRDNLVPLKPRNWRLRGNELIADTEVGELVQRISPDYILKGTDDQGLPILVKVTL